MVEGTVADENNGSIAAPAVDLAERGGRGLIVESFGWFIEHDHLRCGEEESSESEAPSLAT